MTDDLIERLKARAMASFEANKSFGRKGKEWALETEPEWQAASALSSLQERVRELEGASRKAVRLLSNSGLHELTRIADARDVLITTLERK